MPALYELVPDAERRWCARHLNTNWKKKHKGKGFDKLFWSCVFSTNMADFKKNTDALAELSQQAHDDMLQHQPNFWCRAFFERQTQCELTDNNLCEAFNGRIVPARTMNVISCLEEIRKLVMKRLPFNKKLSDRWVGDLGPRIRKKLHKNKEESWKCSVIWNEAAGYEIVYYGDTYVVNLDQKSCVCGSWELSGIPCCHVICAIYDKN